MPEHLTADSDYPPATWRVLIQPPADGKTNMAIDESILDAVSQEIVPPTLRFYAWSPACLSLGYAQPVSDVDFEQIHKTGWDVVRRLTGGRAILHIDELTYSVAVPVDDPRVAGGVVESYRRLSAGLLAGLRRLGAGVEADRKAKEAHDLKGPVCFEVPSDYEITIYGRKLLGSAQTRRSEVVLQHGALPLEGDLGRICDVLMFGSEKEREEARNRVRRRALTLSEALSEPISMARATGALMAGFCEVLNLQLEEDGLTAWERTKTTELISQKYGTEEWNRRN